MKQSTKYAIAFSTAIGGFMATLELTVINVTLVKMADSLKTDLATIQWVVTASFLAVASAIPVSGYLGHRYGLKRLFMLSVGFFTIGSLLCALTNDVSWLIFFRVLQGLGGGAIVPLGQALALAQFEPEERAKALGIVAFPILLAPAIGPSLGGILTENLSWQWIFYMNLPLGLLCLALSWRNVPADQVKTKAERSRFDFWGLGLSMLGVVLVIYGLNLVSQINPASQTAANPRGTIYGWGDGGVWAFIGTGLGVLLIFVIYSLRQADPVLELRLFTRYDYTIASIITWLIGMASYAGLLLIPVFLQQVHQKPLTVQEAGLFLIPQGLATAVGVVIGMSLYKKIGMRLTAIIGTLLIAGASVPLTQLQYDMDLSALEPWLVLRGVGLIIVFMPANTLALEKLTGPLLAKGTALFNVTRQIISSLGVALSITLYVQQTNQRAAELTEQGVGAPLLGVRAATAGMNDVFIYMMIACFAVLLPCLLLPAKPKAGTGNSEAITTQEAALVAE